MMIKLGSRRIHQSTWVTCTFSRELMVDCSNILSTAAAAGRSVIQKVGDML